MTINERASGLDEMVKQGQIVEGIQKYFADEVATSDYGNLNTENKAQFVAKIQGLVDNLAKVNEITFHNRTTEGNTSNSEFTFDFDLKDGSKYYHHEIISRDWNDAGMVVRERYFDKA